MLLKWKRNLYEALTGEKYRVRAALEWARGVGPRGGLKATSDVILERSAVHKKGVGGAWTWYYFFGFLGKKKN